MIYPIAQLSGAVRVTFVDCYGSGSVWWFVLRDQKRREAFACIDRRELSPTFNRLFDGSRHPKQPNVKLLDLGSVEESIVVPAISRCLDSEGLDRQQFTDFG